MRAKRASCESQIRGLCRQWILAVYELGKPVNDDSFDGFYDWVARIHPEYLCFTPRRNVADWVGFWFEQECERAERERLRVRCLHEGKSEIS